MHYSLLTSMHRCHASEKSSQRIFLATCKFFYVRSRTKKNFSFSRHKAFFWFRSLFFCFHTMFSMKQRFSLLGSSAASRSKVGSSFTSLVNDSGVSCGSPSSLRGYSSTSQLHTMCYSCASKHMQQEKKKKAKLLPFVHQNLGLAVTGSSGTTAAPAMRRHFSTSKVSRFSAAAYDPYTIEEYVKGKVTHSLDAIFKPKSGTFSCYSVL